MATIEAHDSEAEQPIRHSPRWRLTIAPGAAVCLPLLGLFGGRDLFPGVALADLLLASFTLLVLWRVARARTPLVLPAWLKWGAAFWLWAAIAGTLVGVLGSPFAFEPIELLRSLAKLAFYLVATAALCTHIGQHRPRDVARWARVAFLGLALVSIGVYAANSLGWSRVDDLSWLGSGPPPSRYYELRWYGDSSPRSLVENVFLRARGLDLEPSKFGQLMALAVTFLAFSAGRSTWPQKATLALVALSALLTFSLSAYAILGCFALVAFVSFKSLLRNQQLFAVDPRHALVAVLGIGLLLAFTPVGATAYHTIVLRIVNVARGEADNSAKARVAGSWEVGSALAAGAPALGVGLGNFDIAALDQKDRFAFGDKMRPGTSGWNAYSYVLATTGIPGLLLFLVFLYHMVRRGGAATWVICAYLFVSSEFLAAPFWIMAALLVESARPRGR